MKKTFVEFLFLFLLFVFGGCGNFSDTNYKTRAEPAPAEKPAINDTTENVTITSEGNVEIIGTYFEPKKEPSPAVLLLHQWGSDRHSFDDFAKKLQTAGFGVLTIDGRGFGDSTKTSEGETVLPERTDEAVKGMLVDIGNAYEFLERKKEIDSTLIQIGGASYGSSLAILYAAGNKKVKAVALVSPGLNYFGNMEIEPAIKAYGARPILLVAAEDDKDSAATVKMIVAEFPDKNYIEKIYENGGHGTALFSVGLADVLESFFASNIDLK
ncbi:MAG: alpha/beta hydrolase [Pyrinomonadaceae bacterium]